MKTCENDCYPICNHCRHVRLSVDEKGRRTYPGTCVLTGADVDPLDICNEFECCLLEHERELESMTSKTKFDLFLEEAVIWVAFWTNVAVVVYRQIREKVLG